MKLAGVLESPWVLQQGHLKTKGKEWPILIKSNVSIKLIGKALTISNVGGTNGDGSRWKLKLDRAIEGIESGKWKSYVSVDGESVLVIVAKTASGRKYLKTQNDGEQPNNLLSLPKCP